MIQSMALHIQQLVSRVTSCSSSSLLLIVFIAALFGDLVLSDSIHRQANIISQPLDSHGRDEYNPNFWYRLGSEAIAKTRAQRPVEVKAKNVIIFLGDGMGISTITSARILKGQLAHDSGEEGLLSFEELPYSSLVKTYNVDRQVPDSAGTATAYLCGVKGSYETLGVNGNVQSGDLDCDASQRHGAPSILRWAQEAGKATGVVTTTRITHATPGASYSHIAHRDWESNAKFPDNVTGACKDIARQLIEDLPGKNLNVIMGGGRRHFLDNNTYDLASETLGERTDGRNLINEWIADHRNLTGNHMQVRFVNSTSQLNALDARDVKYLMGLFAYNHLEYEQNRDASDPNGQPSLTDMTLKAIEVLSQNPNGFVMLVEGGRIDHAHHSNLGSHALHETLQFENAIKEAKAKLNMQETLIIVTADHSHSLTLNGYPKRGNNILGLGDVDSKGRPFTTLMYTTGPGFKDPRDDLTNVNTTSKDYRQLSTIYQEDSHHTGEDVAVYAQGPWAHLFQGTQDQTYVAHVMGYAACMGPFSDIRADHCKKSSSPSSGMSTFTSFSSFIQVATALCAAAVGLKWDAIFNSLD